MLNKIWRFGAIFFVFFMHKIPKIIFLLTISFFSAQQKFYEFPIVDGSKIPSMRQSNDLVQNGNRLVASFIVKDKKSNKYFYFSSLVVSGLLLQPITHEEGHRSVLTGLNIGAISQPIFDKNMTAKVVGVADATLKNLRDTDLPNYIRLHTAGLESDYAYLNSLNAKLSFEEEEYKYVKGDLYARNVGVAGYYLSSFMNRKFSLDEYKTPELERDIVGNDIWGMIRHLHRPATDFHRYTTWDELTPEEKKYANKTALMSFINFVNPNLFKMRNFTLKNGNKIGFDLGYSLAPFGDYIAQNVYYMIPDKGIKLNPYLIEYFNKNNFFWGGGIKLYNYQLNDKVLINSSLDIWNQPENLDFNTSKGKFGIGGELNGAYKIVTYQKERENSFYLNLGFAMKTDGFVPETPSLKNDFRINFGFIYSLK